MMFHGFTITHLDSLGHIFWKDEMYNGRPSKLIESVNGATKNNIEKIKDGIFTRGVLVDIPKLKKIDYMPLGTGVFLEDLKAALKEEKVKLREGDMLLIRTGFMKRRAEKGPIDITKEGCPSVHPSLLPYLHRKKIALLASDTPNDIYPAVYAKMRQPVHVIGIARMGLWLLDNCNLEEISKKCDSSGRYEFLMNVIPLRMQNTTGSPVNPIAIF
eukprot:TRINITY_DN10806_c0_g1_i1.p1 TRINITY_DN10806_c0_g1~~TRINITY_DN10806_c0_g1_i1.p1  ORF type:complete len:215 (-),score=61.14 TRINITY_DN10806_c0_g1_i1:1-645(-)